MTDQYQCPFCDYAAGSKGSVKAHITRKTDDNHGGRSGPDYTDEIKTVSITDEQSDTESGTEPETPSSDGGIVPSKFRTQQTDSGGSECCSNPSLVGSEGEIWKVDGQHYRLDSGDRVCNECDSLLEGVA